MADRKLEFLVPILGLCFSFLFRDTVPFCLNACSFWFNNFKNRKLISRKRKPEGILTLHLSFCMTEVLHSPCGLLSSVSCHFCVPSHYEYLTFYGSETFLCCRYPVFVGVRRSFLLPLRGFIGYSEAWLRVDLWASQNWILFVFMIFHFSGPS